VLMAVRNLFMWGGDWLGSALIESAHVHFDALVYINAGTTLLAALLASCCRRRSSMPVIVQESRLGDGRRWRAQAMLGQFWDSAVVT